MDKQARLTHFTAGSPSDHLAYVVDMVFHVFLLHAWNLGLCSASRLGFDHDGLVGLQIQKRKEVGHRVVDCAVRDWTGGESDG